MMAAFGYVITQTTPGFFVKDPSRFLMKQGFPVLAPESRGMKWRYFSWGPVSSPFFKKEPGMVLDFRFSRGGQVMWPYGFLRLASGGMEL